MKIYTKLNTAVTETKLLKVAQKVLVDAGLIKKTPLVKMVCAEVNDLTFTIQCDTADDDAVVVTCPIDVTGALCSAQVTCHSEVNGVVINMISEVRRHPLRNTVRYTAMMLHMEAAYKMYTRTKAREERAEFLKAQIQELKVFLNSQEYTDGVRTAMYDTRLAYKKELADLTKGTYK